MIFTDRHTDTYEVRLGPFRASHYKFRATYLFPLRAEIALMELEADTTIID
jgi:hypothetical protein